MEGQKTVTTSFSIYPQPLNCAHRYNWHIIGCDNEGSARGQRGQRGHSVDRTLICENARKSLGAPFFSIFLAQPAQNFEIIDISLKKKCPLRAPIKRIKKKWGAISQITVMRMYIHAGVFP